MTVNQPQRLGKYEILSVLGRGGMGVVYKARDEVIDRVVAVKTISPGEKLDADQVQRFLTEARSAGRLHHQNIVTVFDYGEHDEVCYIVLEYAEGVDLGHMISNRQPLALPARVDLILQVCNGLGFAHHSGVTHRDMKPSNIRILNDGTAKILDFGLARYDDTQLTKTGYISGTIAYMSPERMNGTAGTSDDVFALGAVAYELLTYERAFPGATTPEVMFKIMTQSPKPPSEVAELPPALDPIILKCLDREPANRYESPYDFGAALDDAFCSDEVQEFVLSPSRSPEFKEALRQWSARRKRDTRTRSSDRMTPPHGFVAPITLDEAESAATPTQLMSQGTTLRPRPDTQSATSAATSISTRPSTGITAPEALPSGLPTEVLPAERAGRKRGMAIAIAAIVAAIAIGAIVIGRSRPEPASPAVKATTVEPATTTVAVATTSSNLEELSSPIQTKPLTNTVAPPATSTVAVTAATSTQQRPRPALVPVKPTPTVVPQRPPIAKPVPVSPQPIVTAPPQPVPATPVVVTPQPQPQPQPPPPAPQPTADPRAEVASFVRRMAAAYQARDASFFREHDVRYSEAMANAIRNSPSVRVQLALENIDVADADHATATVQRTDEFEGGAPPGKQRLIYHLERRDGQWKIVRLSR